MTKKTNEPSGWNPVFEFPLDDRNTIIIDGVKYKRVEEPKTPAEEAFKRVYGYYPEGCERSVWIAFQKGYDEAQKDYKVGEYQPTPQEPEELKTLYDVLRELDKPMFSDDVCSAVKRWISQYADNVMCGEYKKGYEYCLTVLEENLK